MLPEPVVKVVPAPLPMAILLEPVVAAGSEPLPRAVLFEPFEIEGAALYPTAVFEVALPPAVPVSPLNARAPSEVF